jgi:hypothetical protein
MLAPPYLPSWSLFGREGCLDSWVPVSVLGKWFWLSLNRVGFEVWHVSKSVHATVLAIWPREHDHRARARCWGRRGQAAIAGWPTGRYVPRDTRGLALAGPGWSRPGSRRHRAARWAAPGLWLPLRSHRGAHPSNRSIPPTALA